MPVPLPVVLLCCAAMFDRVDSMPSDWRPLVQAGNMLFSASVPGDGLFPNIGNGFIAGDVGCSGSNYSRNGNAPPCGTVHVAGVFNGAQNITPSHRGALPGLHSVNVVTPNGGELHSVGSALDLRWGIFYNRTIIKGAPDCGHAEVEQVWYAHRLHRSILVHELRVLTNHSCTVHLQSCNYDGEYDFVVTKRISTNPGGVLASCVAKTAELPSLKHTSVDMSFIPVPQSVTFDTTISRRVFFAAVRTSLEGMTGPALAKAAEDDLHTVLLADPDDVLAAHKAAWDIVWEGGLEVSGNLTVASTVNSSLYYILSGVREDWPYGLSPGGLARDAYYGHSFWDTETWIFPSLALLAPSLASTLLEYRYLRLNEALLRATRRGWKGAMWPWESALTGLDCTVAPNPEGELEIHISGDIPMAFRHFYRMSKNTTWLRSKAWPVVQSSAEFFSSRFEPHHLSGNYTILNVQPPDERAGRVNSSVYTNAVGAETLRFAISIAEMFGLSVPSRWREIVVRVYLPVVSTLFSGGHVHPEYDAYHGQAINQADVALLQYPLCMRVPDELARNDLTYYQGRTSGPGTAGFYTGDSAYSIAWLALGNRTAADAQFDLAFDHMDTLHFNIWKEKSFGDFGHLNFITGAGGYIQNFVFGYAGVRLGDDRLLINPRLPPHGVTQLKLRSVSYQGRLVNIIITEKTLTLELIRGLSLQVVGSSGSGQVLAKEHALSLPRARVSVLAPDHTCT